MKKHAIKNAIPILAFGIICLFGSAKTAFSQQTANSTQTDEQRRVELVRALERTQAEVRAGRKYIDDLKEQVKSKQARIDGLNERDAKRVEIESLMQSEIKSLRLAIDEQKSALKVKETEVADLKKELSKLQKKLKASHTREKIFATTTALLFLLLLL